MPTLYITLIILLFFAAYASYKAKKLTAPGALTGGVVAVLIYIGSGFAGVTSLAAFFILATLATSHKKHEKNKLINERHQLIRDEWQVLANGGIAAICGIFAFVFRADAAIFRLMISASLASATADTLSSELGVIYGRRFYNIITIKPDKKGRDGVISTEGTLLGIAGSAAIAIIYALFYGFNYFAAIVLIAGTLGNLTDSILGATFERRGNIGNNTVNVLNTFIAAIIAWLLYQL